MSQIQTSTILIVDDKPLNCQTLAALLHGQGYQLAFALNGFEALTQAAMLMPDLILLDVMMPGMSGFEVCQHLRANPLLAEVPIILITSLDDQKSRLEGLEAGADDFIPKPFNIIELQARVRTITRLNRYRSLREERQKLIQAYEETLTGWARALELKDNETMGHSQRVTELTVELGRIMKISEDELVHIRRGALLHDIGKMGVPDYILRKTSALNDAERVIIEQHPTYAYQMLSPIEYLHPALDIPYCHHEHWDGQGYPRGLKHEQIPLAARIFAVVDVWDALSVDRPYRTAWSTEKIISYIQSLAGTQFDPQVVVAFIEALPQLNKTLGFLYA